MAAREAAVEGAGARADRADVKEASDSSEVDVENAEPKSTAGGRQKTAVCGGSASSGVGRCAARGRTDGLAMAPDEVGGATPGRRARFSGGRPSGGVGGGGGGTPFPTSLPVAVATWGADRRRATLR